MRDPEQPTPEEVEQFFMAAAIAVGMILDSENRESGRGREFFAFRAKAMPNLPFTFRNRQGKHDTGIPSNHPMSYDNYVIWCRHRTEEANHD